MLLLGTSQQGRRGFSALPHELRAKRLLQFPLYKPKALLLRQLPVPEMRNHPAPGEESTDRGYPQPAPILSRTPAALTADTSHRHLLAPLLLLHRPKGTRHPSGPPYRAHHPPAAGS